MNKFERIVNLLHDIKFKLEDKGVLDKEIETHLLLIQKEIDNIRDTEHKTKQRISELLANL
ncbi:hypothetical protein AXJ14_gp189 [Geobacillus virus E3]|uniref:hypothetical protein n=1 Tax=Geobacillus virus E3 TaxID=1572712 RepID=UPI000671BB8F|nr:hypothetical protein AXJ14_gp189 [Geobacillus virus E3]AJA41508.1 hypothetical protein E3_0189 [Geobacillus virus E3]